MNKTASLLVAACLALGAIPANADVWQLAGEDSKIAFGSVKKDAVGEAHHFSELSGSVSDAGEATIEIDVTSVETWIDIRNERMMKHVFDAEKFPKATVSAKLDMTEFEALEPGEMTTATTTATLGFLGQELPVEAELFVVALADNRVMVTSDEMLMLSTADLGITAGVDKLMELAKLPSITRVTPVTMRLIFERK